MPTLDAKLLRQQIDHLPPLADDRAYLVFADWLQAQGHPWGELVVLQPRACAATDPAARAELERAAARRISTARNTAGKFGKVVIAKQSGDVIAFGHGMVKFLPDYLGGQPVGLITHIFVDKDYRDKQVGARLVSMLEDWFRIKRVQSIELQVISGNPDAMAFWKNLGF